ncbi:hypothetical protein AAG906_035765 [Vitis piasezkii]
MNFMSYMAEVSRGWDEPNARDMGRMTSQPNAKGEMYILDDGIDMKTEIAAMERRLEKLEMMNMQPVQAISQTPLQPMPCAICLSYEHLVDECPTIPAEREMFGTIQISLETTATSRSKLKHHKEASILEQAMVNLSKIVGDFVGAQEAINAQVDQRLDRMESMLNKRMDEMQNDMNQNDHSRSGKEVDLPTCKLEHKVWNENHEDSHQGRIDEETHASTFSSSFVWQNHTEKAPSEGCKLHMGSGKLNQIKFWMIKIKRNCKEIERKKSGRNRSKTEQKQGKRAREISQNKGNLCEMGILLPNHSATSRSLCEGFSQLRKWGLAHECHSRQETNFAVQTAKLQSMKDPISQESSIWQLRNQPLAHDCENGCEIFQKKKKKKNSQPKLHFAGNLAAAKHTFGTRVPLRSTVTPISQLRNGCEIPKCEKSQFHSRTPFRQLLDTFRSLPEVQIMHTISRWKAWEVTSP